MTPEEIEADIEKFETEGATHLSPSDFAKHLGIAPQMVHYYVRQGVIEKETCRCGRGVIEVAPAKQALKVHQDKRRSSESEEG